MAKEGGSLSSRLVSSIQCWLSGKEDSLLLSGLTGSFSSSSNPGLGKGRLPYEWIVMAALLIIGTVGLGIRFSFGVFFKSLQDDFGWSRASISGIFSVYLVFCIAIAILGGWALDRYGAKIVFAVMGFFAGLSLLLTSQATAPWHLFLTYSLLLALGTAPIYIASMSTVSRWFIKRRGLALGIVSSGGGIGMIIMAPISAYLISGYGWHTSYLFLSLIAFFTLIPCALLLKRPSSGVASLPDVEEQHYNEPGGFSLLQAAKTRSFWLLLAILFLFSSCSYVVLTHIVPHAIDLGITPIEAASMISFIGIGSVLGRLVMGRLSDSIGGKQAFLICTLLMAGAMLWLIGSSNLWMLYLFTIIFGFSFGATAPLNAVLIGDSFGLRHVGLIMGVIDIGWGIGAASGPALAGYIFDISGSYTPAFLGGIVAALVAAVLILFLRMPKAIAKEETI